MISNLSAVFAKVNDKHFDLIAIDNKLQDEFELTTWWVNTMARILERLLSSNLNNQLII